MRGDRFAAFLGAVWVLSMTGSLPAQGPLDLHTVVHPTGLAADEAFGHACAVDGDFAVVGAPEAVDGGFAAAGKVYVFQFVGLEWQFFEELTASTPQANAAFGCAVDIDGGVIVVGASGGTDTIADSGVVYVFRLNGTGTAWVQDADPVESPSPMSGDQFGASVSLSGPLLVVGEPGDDGLQSESGAAHVYRDMAPFDHEADLSTLAGVTDVDQDDRFGISVAVSGDFVAVGADMDEGGGAAYFFRYSAPLWTLTVRVPPPSLPGRFGTALAIDGDVAVVSAVGESGGVVAGRVAVFCHSGGTWMFEQSLAGSGAVVDAAFGTSLALSGPVLVVGAPGFDGLASPPSGALHHFEFESTWTQTAVLTPLPGLQSGDRAGAAVALGERGLIAGAPGSDLEASSAGSVIVYGFSLNRIAVDTVLLTQTEVDGLGGEVPVSIRLRHNVPAGIGGYSFSLRSDQVFGSCISPVSVEETPLPVGALTVPCSSGQIQADFFWTEIGEIGPPAPVSYGYVRVAAIFSLACVGTLDAGEYEIATVTYDVDGAAPNLVYPITVEVLPGPPAGPPLPPLGPPPTPIEFGTSVGGLVPDVVAGAFVKTVDNLQLPDLSGSVWVPNRAAGSVVQLEYPTGDCGASDLADLDDSVVVPCVFCTPPPQGFSAVAVGFDAIWLADEQQGELYRYYPASSSANTFSVGAQPVAVAIDARGNVWCSNAGDSTVSQLTAGGIPVLNTPDGILGAAAKVPGVPSGLAGDAAGNMWVTTKQTLGVGLNALNKLDPAGRLVLSVTEFADPMTVLVPLDVAIDADGFVWTTLRNASGGDDVIQRRASDGSLAQEFGPDDSIGAFFGSTANAGMLALRRHVEGADDVDLNEAFFFGGTKIARARPLSATPFAMRDLATDGVTSIASVIIDGCDRLLVFGQDGSLRSFDPESLQLLGQYTGSFPVGFDPTFLGDAWGYPLAATLEAQADFDQDDSSNSLELRAGSHPYLSGVDPLTLNASFVAPVTSLACETIGAEIGLSWGIPDPPIYTSIEVHRALAGGASILIATLSGSAVDYLDSALPVNGEYTYSICGVSAGTQSFMEECTSTVGPGRVLESVVAESGAERAFGLFDVAAVPEGSTPSIAEVAYFALDAATSRVYVFDEDFEQLYSTTLPTRGGRRARGLAYKPDNGGTLIYAQGGDGLTTIISEASLTGTPLSERVVVDGGDPLEGQPAGIDYNSFDQVVSLVMPEGQFASGIPVGCEIFAVKLGGEIEYRFSHPEVLQAGWGLGGVSHIVARGEFGLGSNGGTIRLARINDQDRIELVAYNITLTAGMVDLPLAPPSDAIPLHGYPRLVGGGSQNNALDENAMGGFAFRADQAVVVGQTSRFAHVFSLEEPPLRTLYRRGDANVDGTVDLSDSTFLLAAVFGLASLTCEVAGDPNEDDAIDISDPIYLLAFLFGSGPAPAPPFPNCGLPPTVGSLDCDVYGAQCL